MDAEKVTFQLNAIFSALKQAFLVKSLLLSVYIISPAEPFSCGVLRDCVYAKKVTFQLKSRLFQTIFAM